MSVGTIKCILLPDDTVRMQIHLIDDDGSLVEGPPILMTFEDAQLIAEEIISWRKMGDSD